ncbi:hypothetical protein ACXIUT_11585 [Achromobacter denitrificans]
MPIRDTGEKHYSGRIATAGIPIAIHSRGGWGSPDAIGMSMYSRESP